MVNEKFGQRIRNIRTLRGWSIEYLALESGINKNYLSDLERGKRNPTLKMINRLATTFKISLSDLLRGIHD